MRLHFLIKTREPSQVEQDAHCFPERELLLEIGKGLVLYFLFAGEYGQLSIPKASAQFHGVSLEQRCFVQTSPRLGLPLSHVVQLHETAPFMFFFKATDQATFVRPECGVTRQT